MNNQEIYEEAKTLYLNTDMSQRAIARKIGVSEKTITDWKKKFNWDDEKQDALITTQKIQIAGNKIARHYLEDLQRDIDEGVKVEVSEIKVLAEMSKALKQINDRDSEANFLFCFSHFIKFMMLYEPEQASAQQKYIDMFIDHKFKI